MRSKYQRHILVVSAFIAGLSLSFGRSLQNNPLQETELIVRDLSFPSSIVAEPRSKDSTALNELQLTKSLDCSQNTGRFGFWIGEWAVTWQEKDGTTGKGTNRVKYILDSTAIQENFEVTKGIQKGFKGTSISAFNQHLGQWKQIWVDNNAGFLEFSAPEKNNAPVFETDLLERHGEMVKFRMVFKDITASSLTWDWERSENNGKTWELQWRIFYTRIEKGLKKP